MCGIVGGYGGIEPEDVRRMMGRIAHRGPDDDGLVQVAGSALGHRRLSIVDVEGGKQPLATPDKGLYLVGNGEVYNHEEILETLEDRGMTTRSDNEVALRLVAERGPGALSELLGMYAFLMADGDGGFIAARDPVGIKPRYWARPEADGPVFFASEMRAFDEDLQPSVESFPPATTGPIEVQVAELRQLFNSIDPSPSSRSGTSTPGRRSSSSDKAASCRPMRPSRCWCTSIAPRVGRTKPALLRESIHFFFAGQADSTRRRLRKLFRDGRVSLAIGLVVLAGTIALAELVTGRGGGVGEILRESLLIGGAGSPCGGPSRVFLDQWWPIRADARLFDRLASMPVRISYPAAVPAGPDADRWRSDWPAAPSEGVKGER